MDVIIWRKCKRFTCSLIWEKAEETETKKIAKIIQSNSIGSLLSKLAGPLIKVAAPLAKNLLAPLGITAAASAVDAGIQKKKHGWFWNNNSNNFKWRNERHDKNCSSSYIL